MAAALAAALCLGFQVEVFAVPNPVLVPARGNAADCGVMKFNGEYYLIGNSLAGDLMAIGRAFSRRNGWGAGNLGRWPRLVSGRAFGPHESEFLLKFPEK